MKRLIPLLLLVGSLCHAQSTCKVYFSVLWKDDLNNIKQGLTEEQIKWFHSKVAKKNPEICYATPDQHAPIVFFIRAEPAIYHGTRVQTNTSTVPTSGTVTDNSGNTATYTGTATATSSTAVPYSFNYDVLTLSVERMDGDKFTILHNFRRNTICRALYGFCVSNHHAGRSLIEDGVKWIRAGGLADPLQEVVSSPNLQ